MKIYRIENRMIRRAERDAMLHRVSMLDKAAGGEDMISLSAEAGDSFNREHVVRLERDELRMLALKHVNDRSSVLDDLESDREFKDAEKQALSNELAMRIMHRPVKL